MLPRFIAELTELGATVWEPFDRNDQVDLSHPDWPHQVGRNNLRAVTAANAIFAIVNGNPPDEGVIVALA